jgi:molecular chaperone DnaK (HSP70)
MSAIVRLPGKDIPDQRMALISAKDKMAMQRVREAAEKAKIELSASACNINQSSIHHS